MPFLGYVRVSTDEQAAKGVSIDAQAERIRDYCSLYAIDLADVVADPGQSGKSLDRPGLADALARLADGRADGLVVAKLDRLTRSVRDLGYLLDTHFGERGGRQLVSVSESIDTRNAGGRLVLYVLTVVAQWERETIVERTRGALRDRKALGQRTGSVPYGFDLDPTGPTNEHGRPVRLVPNPAELATVGRIVAMADSGISPRKIAAALQAEGVPTKSRRGPWRHSAIAKILARRSDPQ